MKILDDGSMEGKAFSGEKYKGEYPSPKHGEETYEDFYERCQAAVKEGFHLGDLGWNDWTTYCQGSPWGGGEYIQHYTIGEVPDDAWMKKEESDDDNY
jgi:hypothetical protein